MIFIPFISYSIYSFLYILNHNLVVTLPVTAFWAKSSVVVLIVLSISHLINDCFTSFLSPLLPQIRTIFNIGIAETSLLVAFLAFFGAMIQPIIGALGDRLGRRFLAALGPVLAALGMTLLGYAPNFTVLALLIVVTGFGSAMFHPSGAAYITMSAKPNQRGLMASIFSAGGTIGLAIGPLLVTNMPITSLIYLFPIGLLIGIISYIITPTTKKQSAMRFYDYLKILRGPIQSLWAMSVLRSLSTISYINLIGFILTDQGKTEHIGPTLTVFNLAAAIGGIIGGRISDRFGRIFVLRSSIFSTIPLFIALIYSNPSQIWFYPLAFLVGALANGNIPIAVVTAQEYVPSQTATASALMMGFAWGTAGVLFSLVGKIADITSPQIALSITVVLLIPSFYLTLKLPEPNKQTFNK